MLARWWGHYWIGLWILLAGPAVVVLGTLTGRALIQYGPGAAESAVVPIWLGCMWLGGALMLVGLVVWAYKFHTEDPL